MTGWPQSYRSFVAVRENMSGMAPPCSHQRDTRGAERIRLCDAGTVRILLVETMLDGLCPFYAVAGVLGGVTPYKAPSDGVMRRESVESQVMYYRKRR